MNPRTAARSYLGIHAIGAAVAVAISLAAVLVVVRPALRMQAERATMKREHDQQLRLLNELDSTRGGVQGELSRIEDQLAASEVHLQSSRHLNARIAHIVESAAEGDIDIHETRPGSVQDHQRYLTVPIVLAGRGSYSNCAAFLHQLHETLPDTGVMEFELTGNPADRETPAIFRFNLVWYAGPASAGVP
jgi:Tfp pilus assembly protein PilO